MNALERSVRTIVGHLRRLDRRFALVGGLAVSARAEPRLTRDADLAVAVSDDHDARKTAGSAGGVRLESLVGFDSCCDTQIERK